MGPRWKRAVSAPRCVAPIDRALAVCSGHPTTPPAAWPLGLAVCALPTPPPSAPRPPGPLNWPSRRAIAQGELRIVQLARPAETHAFDLRLESAANVRDVQPNQQLVRAVEPAANGASRSFAVRVPPRQAGASKPSTLALRAEQRDLGSPHTCTFRSLKLRRHPAASSRPRQPHTLYLDLPPRSHASQVLLQA